MDFIGFGFIGTGTEPIDNEGTDDNDHVVLYYC